MMTTSTALHLAARDRTDASSPAPVLASRPRGVLHVVEGVTPGRRVCPRTRRPVCRQPSRRLYVVPDSPSPQRVGHHAKTGQRLCGRCTAQLARTSEGNGNGCASWASHLAEHAKTFEDELAGGYGRAYAVHLHGRPVGQIAHISGGWRVQSAGFGVPVDRNLVVASSGGAVRVLGIARELAHLPGGALHTVDGLTGVERAVLDLAAEVDAGKWPTADRYTGRRVGYLDAEIHRRFDGTPTRYTQILNRLLDSPAAAAYAPAVVRRRRDQLERKRIA